MKLRTRHHWILHLLPWSSILCVLHYWVVVFLFGIQSFLFSSLVPLPVCFSFIYLFIFYIMLLGSWLIKSNLTDAFFSCTIMFTLPLEGGGLMGADHSTKMVNCKVMPKTHWHCHLHQVHFRTEAPEHKQDNKTPHATLGGDNDNISHYQWGLGTKNIEAEILYLGASCDACWAKHHQGM